MPYPIFLKQGPDYDPSTRVTKKDDIRKPYYNPYVTNGKMVKTAHARKIFVTFIMLSLLCRHLGVDITVTKLSFVTRLSQLTKLCHLFVTLVDGS